MARVRHLRNAPITEAIVDFRVVLPREFVPDRLRGARERLARDYPKMDERTGMEASVEILAGQPQKPRTRNLGLHGIWLKTDDEKSVAQFRVDGFTFNRLKPYTRWEQILPEALRLWRVYVDLSAPQSVTRVALRYINNLRFPQPQPQLGDYIVTAPQLPPTVPQVLSLFATRLVLEYPDGRMKANVSQVLEVGVETAAPSLVFDIDVYRTGDFGVGSELLERILNDLRAYKNDIFFGSLTERFVKEFE